MPGVWAYSPAGGPFGKGGVPDRLNLWRGVFFAVEVKKDRSNRPTPLQSAELNKIKSAGGIAVVMYGYDVPRLIKLKQLILERTNEVAIRAVPIPNPAGNITIQASD